MEAGVSHAGEHRRHGLKLLLPTRDPEAPPREVFHTHSASTCCHPGRQAPTRIGEAPGIIQKLACATVSGGWLSSELFQYA